MQAFELELGALHMLIVDQDSVTGECRVRLRCLTTTPVCVLGKSVSMSISIIMTSGL